MTTDGFINDRMDEKGTHRERGSGTVLITGLGLVALLLLVSIDLVGSICRSLDSVPQRQQTWRRWLPPMRLGDLALAILVELLPKLLSELALIWWHVT